MQKRKVFDIKQVREEAIKAELKDSDYRPAPSKGQPAKKKQQQSTADDKPVGGAKGKVSKWKA